jgi:hypothetical protein
MIVNFRARGISRGVFKMAQTFTLIIIKKKDKTHYLKIKIIALPHLVCKFRGKKRTRAYRSCSI